MFLGQKTKALTFCRPTISDGGQIYSFIRSCGSLDLNSPYCYLLLCSHFTDTSILVKGSDGKLVACTLGYCPPLHPDVLFIWQIGVSSAWRQQGLAKSMIQSIIQRPGRKNLSFIEATVTDSNQASYGMFASLAESLAAPLAKGPFFEPQHFAPVTHEAEMLIRIGPFKNKR